MMFPTNRMAHPNDRRTEFGNEAISVKRSYCRAKSGCKLAHMAATARRAKARNARERVLQPLAGEARSAAPIPRTQDRPIAPVSILSMGENVPVMMLARPRRKSQIRLMMKSQKRNTGSAEYGDQATPRQTSPSATIAGTA